MKHNASSHLMQCVKTHRHVCLFQDVTSVNVFTIGLVRRVWIATTDHITVLSTIDTFASSPKVMLMANHACSVCCNICCVFMSCL